MGGATAQSTDFWDFLPPIFVKELRQGLRANHFTWPFIAVQIAAIICLSMEYAARHLAGDLGFSIAPDAFQFLFYILLWVVFGLVLPATQFGALQPELSAGRNAEILLLSNLTRWEIVLGKWIVGSVLSLLMLTSLFPYWLVRYLIGSIGDIPLEISHVFGILLINALANAIFVGASGFRNYLARIFLIVISAFFCFLTFPGASGRFVGPTSFSGGNLARIWLSYLAVTVLWVALSLQLGRAKLRLFENPLDPPSSALIIVLKICAPIMTAITAAISANNGWIMVILLTILTLMIDPGPGRKGRKWAQP